MVDPWVLQVRKNKRREIMCMYYFIALSVIITRIDKVPNGDT